MKRTMALIIVLGIVFNLSCRRGSDPVGPPVLDRDYFPNSIGTRWIYQVYDSIGGRQYDKVVEIVDSVRIDVTISAKVWISYEPGRTDTVKRYIAVVRDTVREYFNLVNPWYQVRYILPLSLGTVWPNACGNTAVTDRVDIVVQAGGFPNTYSVYRTWSCVNVYEDEINWFYPKVGVVKSHYRCVGGFCNDNNVYGLKQYSLPLR